MALNSEWALWRTGEQNLNGRLGKAKFAAQLARAHGSSRAESTNAGRPTVFSAPTRSRCLQAALRIGLRGRVRCAWAGPAT